MTPLEHENYAKELLSSLSDSNPETAVVNFAPNRSQSRNAANAMTAILCDRLFKESQHRPIRKTGKTYDWKNGTFNCRNIADRDYLWTNMRRGVANEMHDSASTNPAAYLMACCKPGDTNLNVWALPEPLLYESLASLVFEERQQKYTFQISTDKQRIVNYDGSPDLTPYFRRFQLAQVELLLLKESREVDVSVKREREVSRGEDDTDEEDDEIVSEPETIKLLTLASQQLVDAGDFDPSGVADARERVLSSIVRRRGQPAFREQLLSAYNSRCAITDCNLEAVLEAAHIVPYKGPDTNHPGNGLLLRVDFHTLFDLRLVAVDVNTMTLLVSPELEDTCYDEYRGKPIRIPIDREYQPSEEALQQHRQETGL